MPPGPPDDEVLAPDDAAYGFVYLAEGHRGEYKIGRTNLVDRRVSELGATASVEPRLVHEIKTDDPVDVEAYWHARFADKRLRGESGSGSPPQTSSPSRGGGGSTQAGIDIVPPAY